MQPSCSLRTVENKAFLRKKHLVLVDIACKNVTGVSENCHSRGSHLILKCRRGYRFETDQGIYH